MSILHLYRTPGVTDFVKEKLLNKTKNLGITEIQTEFCFNVDTEGKELTQDQLKVLCWLLAETFEQENFSHSSFLKEVSTDYNSNNSYLHIRYEQILIAHFI